MTSSRSDALNAIHAFLKEDHPELGVVDPDADLIDSRLIDSLRFMNFIFLLEELSGQQFEIEKISVEDFRTLRRIEEKFLGRIPSGEGENGTRDAA